MRISTRIITLSAMSILTAAAAQARGITYPDAPSDATAYRCFGMTVADPYRPLENDTSASTLAWVEAENRVTRSYLDAIPFRDAIRRRLTALNNYRKEGLPSLEADGRYYFSRNDGLRGQAVIYRMDSLNAEPQVFLDPNTLSDDGTVALTGLFMKPDGRYMAYTVSRSGSDWTEIYVLDTATGRLLDDHIEWAKFTGAEWHGDGFYYSAYERPEAGKEFSNANTFHKVYYHRLGTPQSSDTVVYENRREPLYFHSVYVPLSQEMMAVMGGGQGNGNSLYVKDLRTPDAPWVTVTESQDQNIEIVDVKDGRMLIFTSVGAPRNRLVVADIADPSIASWRDLVPESDNVLSSVAIADDKLLLTYDRDAAHHVEVRNLSDGSPAGEIALPTYGTVAVSGSRRSPLAFYSFSSFAHPAGIYTYDTATGRSELYHATEVDGLNPDDYVTEQVFYPSADGTRIPMFITYRKGLRRDGTNPVYLYGYGGFNITLNPGFNPNRLLWLENGGIYAQANLRGGGEYGEPWHLAGTRMEKLNVFNDFIAAAEYMIAQGWTKPELLTIEGGSNGGLLVGACTNMRPDLFRVAVPRVGVMDMMRYHLFTIGWNWAHDYGTADDSAEMAAYLLGYSPLHNIRDDGTPYPAVLVTTADHDDRVVPAHSFKYAATLQAADTGSRPKLIRIDSKAGHGAGKPVGKVIDEYADIYSFIFENLGITPATR